MLPTTAHPDPRLAEWTATMSRSVLRDMIAIVSRPGILSLAGGLPAPELFPRESFAEAMARVLADEPLALQYGPPSAALKREIVALMAERGVACDEEQIFITTGAQQGLDVLARLFLDPGGELILEETVYTGMQQVVAPFRPAMHPVPTDLREGMEVDAVEGQLRAGVRPAFLYAIPTAHNPLGVSLSTPRRERLLALADEFAFPIFEDDPYGLLSYDGPPAAPLKASGSPWVFYLGSFSKIIAPALRVGWIVAPTALVGKLTVVKEASDLESSALMQRAIAAWLAAGHLPAHIERLRGAYRARRDAMLAALAAHFPAEARWTEPDAGMFVWVELPEGTDTVALLERALAEEQVAFIPGHAFAVGGNHARNCMRLNFSNASVAKIEEGVERLGRVLSSQ